MTGSWSVRRLMVTGGGGFLGGAVIGRLRHVGTDRIFLPRSRDYDLRTGDGIGADPENPGRSN